MITNYNLFLDDIRIPTNVTWVDIPKDQHYSLVRNYQEFVDLITLRGLPKFVCYDHDLSDIHYGHGLINRNDLNGDDIPYDSYTEKTGYDCAKWLVDYCMKNGVKHPPYVVHSMNPVGKQNIISYVESYNKTV
jgi:hypothetical protein